MRFRQHWLDIVTVTWIALVVFVAMAHGQDKAIITTSASNAEYQPGSFEDQPAPKPAAVNMMRSVLDRKDLTNPAVKVAWSVWYSENGGEFKQWSGASTFGGITPSKVSTFETAAPPEGSLIQTKTTVTGGTAKFGTVLQMWEVK